MLPARYLSPNCIPFLNRGSPEKTFLVSGNILIPTPLRVPGPGEDLRRIVVLNPGVSKPCLHGGPWSVASPMLHQYKWTGGTPLLNSSTQLIRTFQNKYSVAQHPSIQKWESRLGSRLPANVWQETWLPFRAAKECLFLWQIFFQANATLSWCFPGRPHSDPSIWCPRCDETLKEDVFHLAMPNFESLLGMGRHAVVQGRTLSLCPTAKSGTCYHGCGSPRRMHLSSEAMAMNSRRPLLAALEIQERANPLQRGYFSGGGHQEGVGAPRCFTLASSGSSNRGRLDLDVYR